MAPGLSLTCPFPGVVVWEILSRCTVPYTALRASEVMRFVAEDKGTLARPSRVPHPDALWEMIQLCWRWDAAQRPAFQEVCECLTGMTDAGAHVALEEEAQSTVYANVPGTTYANSPHATPL